jgi:hypothetical protein
MNYFFQIEIYIQYYKIRMRSGNVPQNAYVIFRTYFSWVPMLSIQQFSFSNTVNSRRKVNSFRQTLPFEVFLQFSTHF